MYIAVKGGGAAIENSQRLREEDRRGNRDIPAIDVRQIEEQLGDAVDRVLAEGSLYDRELAALAIKQSGGDMVEAIHLVRTYRSTVPRMYYLEPVASDRMSVERRISACFKDLPGGQVLGPSFDYSHRLLDFSLLDESGETDSWQLGVGSVEQSMPRVVDDILGKEGVVESELSGGEVENGSVGDLTLNPVEYPTQRDVRLQNLARADEGFIVCLAYSTMRGFGDNHGFVGELRQGRVPVEIRPDELGFTVEIGEVEISECETVNQYLKNDDSGPRFTRGYGIAFGCCDRRVIAMALVDRALRWRELGEEANAPAQDEEFVLGHSDCTQAAGFVEHIKLPHYGGFQSELATVRELRQEAMSGHSPGIANPK